MSIFAQGPCESALCVFRAQGPCESALRVFLADHSTIQAAPSPCSGSTTPSSLRTTPPSNWRPPRALAAPRLLHRRALHHPGRALPVFQQHHAFFAADHSTIHLPKPRCNRRAAPPGAAAGRAPPPPLSLPLSLPLYVLSPPSPSLPRPSISLPLPSPPLPCHSPTVHIAVRCALHHCSSQGIHCGMQCAQNG